MIEAQGLSMDYGNFRAVDKCSFEVQKGEIVGLVGPNGAGKTTIMMILSTQIQPTEGQAKINGFDIDKDPISVRNNLGFLPEQAPLYEDMEVREYLSFVGSGRGLDKGQLKKRLNWVGERCGLSPVWCKPIVELSKGYKQRVGLAQALIHDPPVLILDEPTSGLDPLQIMEIRSLIKELSRDKAILFSSHILQEISAVTDRAVVISDGKIRADGSLDELSRKVLPQRRVHVRFSGEKEVLVEDIKALFEKEEVKKKDTNYFVIETRRPESVLITLSQFSNEKGLILIELFEERPDLEEVFSALIHRKSKQN